MPRLLAQKLKYLRLRHGTTQAELAQHLGLSGHSHIVKVERGQRTISLELVVGLARFFNQTLDYFLRDSIPVDAIDAANTSSPAQLPEPAAMSSVFGAKLHALRQQHGMSQTSLARQLSLSSRAYISTLETGDKLPSMELVTQIADLFMITTDELFRNTTSATLTANDDG